MLNAYWEDGGPLPRLPDGVRAALLLEPVGEGWWRSAAAVLNAEDANQQEAGILRSFLPDHTQRLCRAEDDVMCCIESGRLNHIDSPFGWCLDVPAKFFPGDGVLLVGSGLEDVSLDEVQGVYELLTSAERSPAVPCD